MKKPLLTLLALSCTLALSACSSSHGGGENNSSTFILSNPFAPTASNAGNENRDNQDNPFKDAIFSPSTNPTALSGGHLTVKADGTTVGATVPANYRDEELDELVIGNTHISLFNLSENLDGRHLDKFKTLSNRDVREGRTGNVSGLAGGWGNYQFSLGYINSRFGVYQVNGEDHLYVQGYATPITNTELTRHGDFKPMPTNGRNIYLDGQALYGKSGNYIQLKSVAIADFDRKTLQVSLLEEISAEPKLQFNASIDNNTFKSDTGNVHSRGGFYGSSANEVSGIFYVVDGSDKGHNGVFGAKDPRVER